MNESMMMVQSAKIIARFSMKYLETYEKVNTQMDNKREDSWNGTGITK